MEIKKSTLTVASLNYTGVISSPYQYFQEEQVISTDNKNKKINQILSQTFHQLLKKKLFYTGDKFSWNMGTIDTIWKTRHSPFNLRDAGWNNDKVQSEDDFKKNWNSKKSQDKLKNGALIEYLTKNNKYSQQELQKQLSMCYQFDLLCFQTLKQIYGSGKSYKQRQYLQFNRPYLNQQSKISKTQTFIKKSNVDIIYFQQSSQKLQTDLKENIQKNYHLVRNVQNSASKSIIYVKKTSFSSGLNNIKLEENKKIFLKEYISKYSTKPENLQEEIKKVEKRFNVNNDSVFAVVDNYIFWNLHLTSKSQNNQKQREDIIKFLKDLKEKMVGYHFVVGGDFNAQIAPNYFDSVLQYNSNSKNIPTVKKRRTFMQPQYNKADKKDYTAKDYIFSSLSLNCSEIEMLNGSGQETTVAVENTSLLPNSNHPYDHYIVKASYQIKHDVTIRKTK